MRRSTKKVGGPVGKGRKAFHTVQKPKKKRSPYRGYVPIPRFVR